MLNNKPVLYSLLFNLFSGIFVLVLQKCFSVDLGVNINIQDLFLTVAGLLAGLIPLVSAVVLFGFERIDNLLKDLERKDYDKIEDDAGNLKDGAARARRLLLDFSGGSFFVIILNLFLFTASNVIPNYVKPAVAFIDIGLVVYCLTFVYLIIVKIVDVIDKVAKRDKNRYNK